MTTDPAHRGLPAEAAVIAEKLQLEPLPEEGGLFRQTYRDEHSTAIFYLLSDPDFSALHELDSVEVYHWYAGDPLQLVLIHPDGRVEEPVLGPDIAGGQLPQIAVAPGIWQGSLSAGQWTLAGTTMAPGFTWEGFRLGEREMLHQKFPHAAQWISRLTRA